MSYTSLAAWRRGDVVPAVLRNRDFATLVIASLVSRLGDSLYEIALVWLVLQRTGDPALVSLAVVANLVPNALVGVPAGALVDRLNRKYVMVASDLVRGVAVLAIPLVARGRLFVVVVLGVAVLIGLFDALFTPARSSLVPRLVSDDQLDAANGLMESANSVSRMFYGVGGIAVGLSGSFGVFYLDSLTFLVSAGLVLTISTTAGVPERSDSGADPSGQVRQLAGDVREGIAYLLGDATLVSVVVLFVAYGVTIGPFGVVLPVYTEEVLGLGSVAYGLLYASVYLGIFVGGLGLSRLDDLVEPRRGAVSAAALVLTGAALAGLGTVPTRVPGPALVSAVFLVLYGVFAVGIWAPTRALVQSVVPDGKLGRVFAVVSVVASGSLPLGVALAGPLLSVVDSPTLFLAEGVVLAVVGTGLLFSPLTGDRPPS